MCEVNVLTTKIRKPIKGRRRDTNDDDIAEITSGSEEAICKAKGLITCLQGCNHCCSKPGLERNEMNSETEKVCDLKTLIAVSKSD